MKKLLFIVFLCHGLIANAAIEDSATTCQTQWVLTNLGDAIRNINRLSPALNMKFSSVVSLASNGAQTKPRQLVCMAHLELIDPTTNKSTDSLNIRYQIVKDSAGKDSISFEPIRD